MAEEFLDKVLSKSCALAKLRGSTKLEARDINYVLENDHEIVIESERGQERVEKRLKRDLKNYTKRLENIQKMLKKGMAHKEANKQGEDGKE